MSESLERQIADCSAKIQHVTEMLNYLREMDGNHTTDTRALRDELQGEVKALYEVFSSLKEELQGHDGVYVRLNSLEIKVLWLVKIIAGSIVAILTYAGIQFTEK